MGSVKLSIPSSSTLFQTSPLTSAAFLTDRLHRQVNFPTSLARLQQRQDTILSHTICFTLPTTSIRLSSNGLSSVEDLESQEEGNALNSEEGEGEDQEDNDNEKDESASSDSKDLENVLSKYIWREPKKAGERMSREDRQALVDSVVASEGNIFSNLDRVRYKLAPSDFGNMLKQFIYLKKWDKVGLVFDWLKVNKKLRPQTVSTYIMLMGKAGLHFRALRAYRSLSDSQIKLNKFVCNSLLKVLINASCIEKAFNIFEEMKDDGFVPDLYSYSTIISGCAKRKDGLLKAKKYKEEILANGLKPDSFVYASILNASANSGMEDETIALFEELKANGIKPSIFHYAPILNMYAEKKKLEEAEKIFEEFTKSGLPPNEVIMNCLMKAYSNSGELEKARRLFTKMPSLRCPPGEITYSLMMDAYCKTGKLEEALILYNEMKAKGLIPGNHVYSILISAYSKLGRADMVDFFSEEIDSRKQRPPDPVLFNSLLKSYCELGMKDNVMKTLKRMSDVNVSPDRSTFNILICYFSKEKMFDIATRTLGDLKSRKHRPNLNSYAPLIIALATAGGIDQAVDLYTEMRRSGIRPSESVCNSLMNTLCKDRKVDEAFKIWKEMMYLEIPPSSQSAEVFLVQCGSYIEILEQVLGDSVCTTFHPEQVNLARVLSSYQKQGLYTAMHRLLDYARVKGLAIDNSTENWDEIIVELQNDGQTDILEKLSARADNIEMSISP